MNRKDVSRLFNRLASENPNPTTELVYETPFELLIAVILSAQATDKSVNKATETLFKIAHTPEAILQLGEEKLKKYIQTIGLYTSKARHIIKTCELLISEFNSQVPNTRKALESLPGVGRKTANVILNTLFGEQTIAVDTHIFRLANRLEIAPGKSTFAVEKNLHKIIPKKFLKNAHHWLLLHGRYVCLARNPKCDICILSELCPFFKKNCKQSK